MSETISNLALYKNYIESLAEISDDKIFLNSGASHASIVFSTIFKTAKAELRIFAESLTNEVAKSDDYLTNLEMFLNRSDSILKILVNKNLLQANNPQLYSMLLSYSNCDKIGIKETKASWKSSEIPMHFTVADDRIFRIEEDIKTFKAFGSFNNKSISKKLTKEFDRIFHSNTLSTKIF